MRGLLKVSLWSTFAFAVIVAAGYAAVPFVEMRISGCNEIDYRAVKSPDGSRDAVIHEVDCGATTPFNTQVSVVKHLFGYETSRETLFVVRGRYDPPVRWIDAATVAIGVPPGERVYREEAWFAGGKARYEHGVGVPTRR